jgi:histidinol dehydrogenase
MIKNTRGPFKKALPAAKKFAELKGLDAHGKSAEVRREK